MRLNNIQLNSVRKHIAQKKMKKHQKMNLKDKYFSPLNKFFWW